MVGIFSRFSGRGIHRRTQSALDDREVFPPSSEAVLQPAASVHGIEVAVEFKPVERPMEPLDFDQPIPCPMPEPSILNDGRIWRERASLGASSRRLEAPVLEEPIRLEPEFPPPRPRPRPPPPPHRPIHPSSSAPEHNLIKLIEEFNASGSISFKS